MSTYMLSFAEHVSLFMRLGFILYNNIIIAISAISANSVYICHSGASFVINFASLSPASAWLSLA